jgi:hypothetical protein
MHITQRIIMGYDVLDTHDRLVNLDPKEREREKAQIELRDELKYYAGMCIYRTMKKVEEHGCILAAHQFG